MSKYTLNARRVFVVQKHTGSSLGAIGERIMDHIVGTGNSEFVDLSFGVIKNDPRTGNVLKDSLVPLAQEANNTIAQAFNAVTDLLSSPEELPRATLSGGAHRISLGFANFTTSPWPGISKSYKKKIDRGILTKRRSNEKKVYWYERGHWVHPPTNANRGGSTKPLHELLRERGFATQKLNTTASNVLSLYGSDSGVTFKTTGLRPAKAKPYSRRTKRGVIAVGGLKGEIILPRKLMGVHGKAVDELYELLYGSLASGKDQDGLARSLSELGMTSESWPDLTQLLLANEYKRPFLSKAFAGLEKELVRRLRAKALKLS